MHDLPIGLMMALAENEPAMRRFAALPSQERSKVIAQASQAASREEMQSLVRDLAGRG